MQRFLFGNRRHRLLPTCAPMVAPHQLLALMALCSHTVYGTASHGVADPHGDGMFGLQCIELGVSGCCKQSESRAIHLWLPL
jgi:hypothetical protein